MNRHESIMKRSALFALSAFGGWILLFGFSPHWQPSAPFISYALLVSAILLTKSNTVAFLLGWLYGCVILLLGLEWIYDVASSFDSSTTSVLSFFIALLSICFALFYGFVALLMRIANDRCGALFASSLFALGFGAITAIHYVWDLGIPYLMPSVSLAETPVAKLLPLMGSIGVSMLIWFISALGATAILTPSAQNLMLFGSTILIVLLLTKSIPSQSATLRPINVAIGVGAFGKDAKIKRYKNLKRMRDYFQQIAKYPNVSLALLPESSVSVPLKQIARHLKKPLRQLKQNGTEVIFGARYTIRSKTYNTLTRSDLKALYFKQRPVPFGEYTPTYLTFLRRFIPEYFAESISFDKENAPFQVGTYLCTSAICYEAFFPFLLRKNIIGANLLLFTSDLEWFKDKRLKEYMLRMARVRALEFQKPLLYSVNFGKGACIDAYGTVVKSASADTHAPHKLITCKITPTKGETVFAKFPYGAFLIFLFTALFGCFLSKVTLSKGVNR